MFWYINHTAFKPRIYRHELWTNVQVETFICSTFIVTHWWSIYFCFVIAIFFPFSLHSLLILACSFSAFFVVVVNSKHIKNSEQINEREERERRERWGWWLNEKANVRREIEVHTLHWIEFWESEWMLVAHFHMQNVFEEHLRTWLYGVVMCRYKANVIQCNLFVIQFIIHMRCCLFGFFFSFLLTLSVARSWFCFCFCCCWHPLLFWLICLLRSMKSIRIQNSITGQIIWEAPKQEIKWIRVSKRLRRKLGEKSGENYIAQYFDAVIGCASTQQHWRIAYHAYNLFGFIKIRIFLLEHIKCKWYPKILGITICVYMFSCFTLYSIIAIFFLNPNRWSRRNFIWYAIKMDVCKTRSMLKNSHTRKIVFNLISNYALHPQ